MKYYSTKPKLIQTTNRGNKIYASFSYPEKNKPLDLAHLFLTLGYLKVYPRDLCERIAAKFEKANEIEKTVRKKLKDLLPDWESAYKN